MVRTTGLLLALLAALLLAGCGIDPARIEPGMNEATPTVANPVPARDAAPFDVLLIDDMLFLQLRDIDIAQRVIQQSDRPELQSLAVQMIARRRDSITALQDLREQFFPDVSAQVVAGTTPNALSTSVDTGADEAVPFDLRALNALISGIEQTLSQAQEALTRSERAELRPVLEDLIAAHQGELTQLQQWRQDWFQQ